MDLNSENITIANFNEFDIEKAKISYTFPLPNHENGGLMAIAALYAFLFMIGTCGNSAILAVVHHVRSNDRRARQNTTLIYICVLSIVDFISMLPLPMTIVDQVLGFWMFGSFACKLFRVFEHIGKVFSTFILVCFSIDRYCAVCHPLKVNLRKKSTAYAMLLVMFCITCALLLPILISAQTTELILDEKYNPELNEIIRVRLYKCHDNLSNDYFILFIMTCFIFVQIYYKFSSLGGSFAVMLIEIDLWYQQTPGYACCSARTISKYIFFCIAAGLPFLLGFIALYMAYLVPLLMMSFFYHEMLVKLFEQNRLVRKNVLSGRQGRHSAEDKLPVVRIATYTFVICIFHFVCWTPYWVSALYTLYLEFFPNTTQQSFGSAFIYLMYGIHALPYFNSASNFILYGLLNSQLHQSRGCPSSTTPCQATHLKLTIEGNECCSEMRCANKDAMLSSCASINGCSGARRTSDVKSKVRNCSIQSGQLGQSETVLVTLNDFDEYDVTL